MHPTATPSDDAHLLTLAQQAETDGQRLKDLAEMFADGAIERAEWMTAREKIQPRLDANRRAPPRPTGVTRWPRTFGRGDELRAAWDGPNLSRQVAIIKAVLAGATILPATVPGGRGLDPNRVQPVWRV